MCIACNVKRNEVGKGIKDCILIKLNATDENNAKTKPQKQEIGHSPSGNFFLSFSLMAFIMKKVAIGNVVFANLTLNGLLASQDKKQIG
jgi:hypothetical protein